MDVNKAISMAVRAGKVNFGYKQSSDMMKAGKAKLVILASNCPEKMRVEISLLSQLSNIPVFQYASSNVDLGVVCGRHHPVVAMALTEFGDSENLMRLVKGVDVK